MGGRATLHPALTPACGGFPAGGLVNACARPGAGVLGLAAGLMAVMSMAPLVQQVTTVLCRLPPSRSAVTSALLAGWHQQAMLPLCQQ